MPLYDFKCINPVCGHTKELLIRSSEDEDTQKCEQCGSDAIRQFPHTGKGVVKGGTPTFRRSHK